MGNYIGVGHFVIYKLKWGSLPQHIPNMQYIQRDPRPQVEGPHGIYTRKYINSA